MEICVIPLEYLIELYSKYEVLFIRIFFKNSDDKKVARKRKFLIIKECGLSVRNVLLFQKNYCSRMYVKMADDKFIEIINQFKEEKNKK